MDCVVCDRPGMRGPTLGYQYVCAGCGHRASDLAVTIAGSDETALDEGHRSDALRPLRQMNFRTILRTVGAIGLAPPARILEVGCAHGWFLDEAAGAGYRCLGIEPDAGIAAGPLARGHTVRVGLFPAAVPPGEGFDAVAFNDVFEHLPDPDGAARAIHDTLLPGGLAVLNLPSRHGVLFQVADAMGRLGMRGAIDRLWQKGFPSPHLHYFSPDGLARLMARHGLQEVHRSGLPSMLRAGLWQRLRYDRAAPVWRCAVQWAVLWPASFFMAALPADIGLQVFQRPRR